MKLLKVLLGLIVILVAVVFGGGLMLADKAHVEREVLIQRPPAQVFAFLNGFHRFEEWSPWGKEMDPDQVITLSGPATGVGARMDWQGEKTGTGSQTITAVELDRRIEVALDFGAQGTAVAAYTLQAEGDATRLVWSLDSDAEGNPVDRWFGVFLDRMVGPDYERGLAKLKQVLEAEPLPVSTTVMEAGMEAESTDATAEPDGTVPAEDEADAAQGEDGG